MSQINKEDFLLSSVDTITMLSLKSSKLKILIVGAGEAGFIKAKAFAERGCEILVVGKDVSPNFTKLCSDKLQVVKGDYSKELILDKHLVIIATDDALLNYNIRQHCNELSKLYIDTTNIKESLCIMPCQRETEEVVIGIQGKVANPKTTVFLADKAKELLSGYKEYIKYAGNIRNTVIGLKEKKEIMGFISTDDFYFFHTKGCGDIILKMFYGGIDFETKNCNKKK